MTCRWAATHSFEEEGIRATFNEGIARRCSLVLNRITFDPMITDFPQM